MLNKLKFWIPAAFMVLAVVLADTAKISDRPLGPEVSWGPVWIQSLENQKHQPYGLRFGCDIGKDDEGIMLSLMRF